MTVKTVNTKEMEAVLALPAPDRFRHFVNVVADWAVAWGLHDEGWALASDDDGVAAVPLWPARAYAAACATEDWASMTPEPIALDDLLEELLPSLKRDAILAAVFPTPSRNSVVVAPDELRAALEAELARY